jgi:hypothetical protein
MVLSRTPHTTNIHRRLRQTRRLAKEELARGVIPPLAVLEHLAHDSVGIDLCGSQTAVEYVEATYVRGVYVNLY